MSYIKYYIGKIITIIFVLFIVIAVNYKCYDINYGHQGTYEYGTVTAKGTTVTGSKYNIYQHNIISFKFDNPKYGVQEIELNLNSYSRLNVGDRTAFYKSYRDSLIADSSNDMYVFLEFFCYFIDIIIALILFVFIIYAICNIVRFMWNLHL